MNSQTSDSDKKDGGGESSSSLYPLRGRRRKRKSDAFTNTFGGIPLHMGKSLLLRLVGEEKEKIPHPALHGFEETTLQTDDEDVHKEFLRDMGIMTPFPREGSFGEDVNEMEGVEAAHSKLRQAPVQHMTFPSGSADGIADEGSDAPWVTQPVPKRITIGRDQLEKRRQTWKRKGKVGSLWSPATAKAMGPPSVVPVSFGTGDGSAFRRPSSHPSPPPSSLSPSSPPSRSSSSSFLSLIPPSARGASGHQRSLVLNGYHYDGGSMMDVEPRIIPERITREPPPVVPNGSTKHASRTMRRKRMRKIHSDLRKRKARERRGRSSLSPRAR